MPEFKVNIKWGKKTFEKVELSTDEPPEVFKAQIFTLTSVPLERQKLMVKGAVIKDEWGKAKLKNGATLLLLGSAEELPSEPVEKTVFLEDMTESELVSAMDLSSGLENLGNTCYMNSTVQVLKVIPELNDALFKFQGSYLQQNNSMDQLSSPITASLRELYKLMDKKTEPEIKPLILLQLLRMHYPQFAEKNEQGQFMQQDANECFMEFVKILQQNLPAQVSQKVQSPSAAVKKTFVDQIFGIEYKVKMKCIEEGADEPEVISSETGLQLNCFISQDVKYLITGIKSKLNEELTKRSPSLGRDAKYSKISEINRLPGYLCVQMVRFFFKKGNINAKILKDVKFPMSLDLYDLCSDELKDKLSPMRKKFEDEEERIAEERLQLKSKKEGDGKTKTKEVVSKTSDDANVEYERYDFEDDIGSNNCGHYELQGVITHQGRSSSSGHYVGWVRKKGDQWLKCDDETVTPVSSEDVLKLSGGGDWHIAYILLYGPRRFPKSAETANDCTKETVAMETEASV